jgi:hypothetical protein
MFILYAENFLEMICSKLEVEGFLLPGSNFNYT